MTREAGLSQNCRMQHPLGRRGFTLIEIMLGAAILGVAMSALLGSVAGEAFLTQSARNLTAAMNDATRVMEQIRQQNTASNGLCGQDPPIPSAAVSPSMLNFPPPPLALSSWNYWLNTRNTDGSVGPGSPKSLSVTDVDNNELVIVTCREVGDQDGNGIADDAYCGKNQWGRREWYPWYQGTPPMGVRNAHASSKTTSYDPIRVTVAVGWLQRQRAIGNTGSGAEFTEAVIRRTKGQTTRGFYVGPDADGDGVIESQAMLTTVITCR